MKFLVTGVFGYIGSAFTKRMLTLGHAVVGIDNLMYEQDRRRMIAEMTSSIPSGQEKSELLTYYHFDLRDEKLLSYVLEKHRFDAILHFGGLSSVWSCNHNKSFTKDNSTTSLDNILKIAGKYSLPIVYNSTSSVYGASNQKRLLDETVDLPEPTDYYCASKLSAERTIVTAGQQSGLRYMIFRPATVFGCSPRLRIELLPNHFCYMALSKGLIRVANLNAYRAFISIDTLVSVYENIVTRNIFNNEVYNVGSYNMTKLEVAIQIQRIIDCKIETMEDFGDLRNLQISSEKLEGDGIRIDNHSLGEELKPVVDWMSDRLVKFEKSNFSQMLNMPLSNWLSLI